MARIETQDGEGNVIAVEDDGLPEPVPASITPTQAQIALHRIGKLAFVDALIEMAGPEAKIRWQRGTVIERGDELVAGVTAALGMTDAEMDDLFRAAAGI